MIVGCSSWIVFVFVLIFVGVFIGMVSLCLMWLMVVLWKMGMFSGSR